MKNCKCIRYYLQQLLLLQIVLVTPSCTPLSVQSNFLKMEPKYSDYIAYHLPKSVISPTVKKNATGVVTISKALVKMVTDPNAKFRLDLLENAYANDEYTIGLGTSRLLSNAKIANEDKIPTIVAKIGGIAEQANKLAFRFAANERPANKEYKVDLVFDPNGPRQVAYTTKFLAAASGVDQFQLILKNINGDYFYPENRPDKLSSSKIVDAAVSVSSQCDGSICFRTTMPILMEIKSRSHNISSRQIAEIADQSQVSSYNIRRAPCVKKINNLTFSDGVLTKLEIKKPSEVLGCLSIPASVLKAAIGITG